VQVIIATVDKAGNGRVVGQFTGTAIVTITGATKGKETYAYFDYDGWDQLNALLLFLFAACSLTFLECSAAFLFAAC
jgi:hypothetical protein